MRSKKKLYNKTYKDDNVRNALKNLKKRIYFVFVFFLNKICYAHTQTHVENDRMKNA